MTIVVFATKDYSIWIDKINDVYNSFRKAIGYEHEIYEFLLKQLYAWWERGKREFPENKNWDLVWVSPRVAKRESRRFTGPYTLTQIDVEKGVVFDDAIGFYCSYGNTIIKMSDKHIKLMKKFFKQNGGK